MGSNFLPAIAEDNDPLDVRLDTLWEDRYNSGVLEERKKQVGEFWFRSMYSNNHTLKG